MTYCLAMRLDEGLVFLSDTRTNAGVDHVGTYRKMHVFQPGDDRLFVLQSAGNLATTQEVTDLIVRDLAGPGPSLATVDRLFEAALYIGRLSAEVAGRHSATLGSNANATFVLGGQIGDESPDILLVYPEGNYIRASDDRPFLQIGETKFGKAWLDLAVRSNADMTSAAKVALSSMVATAVANVSSARRTTSGCTAVTPSSCSTYGSTGTRRSSIGCPRHGAITCSPRSRRCPMSSRATSKSSRLVAAANSIDDGHVLRRPSPADHAPSWSAAMSGYTR